MTRETRIIPRRTCELGYALLGARAAWCRTLVAERTAAAA